MNGDPLTPPRGWTKAPEGACSDGWMHQHAADGRNWVHLWGSVCDAGNGPGMTPVNRVTPTTDVGTVDFQALLAESWQPIARDRLNVVLGRPYLATQLAHYLPADVCMRLVDRLEGLVEREVAREVDRIHADVNEATRQTLARLAAQADQKLEELRRERFSNPSRLD